MSIVMQSVVSSNLNAVGYDSERNELHVEFKGGKAIYVYRDVPAQLHTEMMGSASKGKFFNLFIRKGGFKFEKREIGPVVHKPSEDEVMLRDILLRYNASKAQDDKEPLPGEVLDLLRDVEYLYNRLIKFDPLAVKVRKDLLAASSTA